MTAAVTVAPPVATQEAKNTPAVQPKSPKPKEPEPEISRSEFIADLKRVSKAHWVAPGPHFFRVNDSEDVILENLTDEEHDHIMAAVYEVIEARKRKKRIKT